MSWSVSHCSSVLIQRESKQHKLGGLFLIARPSQPETGSSCPENPYVSWSVNPINPDRHKWALIYMYIISSICALEILAMCSEHLQSLQGRELRALHKYHPLPWPNKIKTAAPTCVLMIDKWMRNVMLLVLF